MLRKTARIIALSFLLSQSVSYSFVPTLPIIALMKVIVTVAAAHPVAVGGATVGAAGIGTYESIKRIYRWLSSNNQHQD
jgi:hypothetical protein